MREHGPVIAVSRTISLAEPLGRVQAFWYAPEHWRSWVDGFASVAERSGEWPRRGATIVWDSTPHGRGRVIERVLEYRPGAGQTVSVSDARLEGTQTVSFALVAGLVSVTLALRYELRDARLLDRLVDWLFIRRALGDSLSRTLAGFGRELTQADDLKIAAETLPAPDPPGA